MSKHPRLAAYGLTYLGCALLFGILVLVDALGKEAAPDARARGVLQVVLLSVVMGAMGVPIRLLLGIFPEPSSSSGVRLVRRVLFGILCGPIPLLLIASVLALYEEWDPETAQIALVFGLLFGIVAGLVDSLYQDARTAS